MRIQLSAFILGAAVLSFASPKAAAEEASLPTLIVAPFGGDRTAMSYWQPAMGEGLSEMLVSEIGKINKFQVLENSQLGELKEEIRLGEDGWVQQSEKVEKGGFAAADFMITAKVTKFGSNEKKVGLGGFVPGSLGNLGVRQTTSDVRIDWRLVDAATRKIIKTGTANGTQKGMGFDVGANVGGNGGKIGFNNKEFMDSALGKATVTAMANIIADLQPMPLPESGRVKQKAGVAAQRTAAADVLKQTPGKVLAVPGKDSLIVSLGSKQGFKEGDKLDLYETTDVKDDSGAVVFTDEKLVGEITIQSVQEERSRASYSGSVAVKQGWKVKAK